MVDASVVIPIFILVVFSLISLCIFFFEGLKAQTDVHKYLVNEAMKGTVIFNIKNKTTETSKNTGGLSKLVLTHKSSDKIYVFNQSEIIRIGGMIEFDGDGE